MSDEFTNIRVYRDDREALAAFGRKAHDAFHALITERCAHEESQRVYVTAVVDVPTKGKMSSRKVSGFFCRGCGRYVFTKADESATKKNEVKA